MIRNFGNLNKRTGEIGTKLKSKILILFIASPVAGTCEISCLAWTNIRGGRIFSTFETGAPPLACSFQREVAPPHSVTRSFLRPLERTLSFISFIRIWEAGGKNKTNMLMLARSPWARNSCDFPDPRNIPIPGCFTSCTTWKRQFS